MVPWYYKRGYNRCYNSAGLPPKNLTLFLAGGPVRAVHPISNQVAVWPDMQQEIRATSPEESTRRDPINYTAGIA